MKNIQYIIIFTLLIIVALAATQIQNYKNISNQLLDENTFQLNHIKSLKTLNSKLKQTIISLETNLKKLEYNISQEQNNSSILKQEIILLKSQILYMDTNKSTNNEQNSTNAIILEDNNTQQYNFQENDITGFN